MILHIPGNKPYLDPAGEMKGLAGQGPAKESNAESNEAPTEALTPLEASIPPLIPLISKDLFTKFMKVFMKTMQVRLMH